jgi:hypothetical protein
MALTAQDETRVNSIGLSWGMGNLIRQDLVFTPAIHKAWSPVNVAVSYNRSKKLEQRAYLKFGSYKTSIGEDFTYYWDNPDETEVLLPHQFLVLDLSYSLGKAVYRNEKLKLTVGGRSRNYLHVSYYTYGINYIQHFDYNISFGLDAWTNVNYTISEKHRLEANVALPLFSYNARPPYMSQDAEFYFKGYSHSDFKTLLQFIADGKMRTVKEVRGFDLDVSYYYSISDRFEIGCSYWLSSNINELPRKYTSFENIFYITGKFNF